jgi:hypothetical protein
MIFQQSTMSSTIVRYINLKSLVKMTTTRYDIACRPGRTWRFGAGKKTMAGFMASVVSQMAVYAVVGVNLRT